MGNSAKNKGDEGEREAVAFFNERYPELVRAGGAERMLGAGRRDDIGDLRVFADVAVQVKKYDMPYMAGGLRQAAKGAYQQMQNAQTRGYEVPFHLGVVPIPRAAKNAGVRWLATVETWPTTLPERLLANGGPHRFTSVSKLLAWIRDDEGPHGYLAHPRTERIATHGASLTDTVIVAPIEAWMEAYRVASEALRSHPEFVIDRGVATTY